MRFLLLKRRLPYRDAEFAKDFHPLW